ncbi:uncharacterized protein PHACADRAFT_214257 [Phanerochaete carnosa HHB-10118-sp]|uniref:Uncharacterized protein n=1 Tax=Phanerochaete carnosa (strain HHB-10118-sp) TaxID=650164 RepID=K5VSI6_PHACS|nr:uncharacterized protein PHACADRAFT_214257 [Phanerochaete carnosa HHB-10118-sp]EKM49735.1 hypothetical protein PHACADRAFT_214257 [Phanerochaete carnosa HHB-10118-sp]
MDAALPEEILREILSHNLRISHAGFCYFYYDDCGHPISPPTSRCSNLLLVSKRWLRIGTPLLYECVALSKPDHTTAVSSLPRTHPHVDLAVRCLRLEGGLGKDLVHIAKLTPKLHSIYITFNIKSVDSITGLKKAFPLFRPTNLYIQKESHMENKKVAEARTLVCTHVKGVWTSLRSLILSDRFADGMDRQLADALAESSIEEFGSLTYDADRWIREGLMRRILENPRLQRVVCRGAVHESTTRKTLQKEGFPDAIIRMFTFVHHRADDRLNMILAAMDSVLSDEEL